MRHIGDAGFHFAACNANLVNECAVLQYVDKLIFVNIISKVKQADFRKRSKPANCTNWAPLLSNIEFN